MTKVKDKKGRTYWVAYVNDVEPNEGGFYCEVYKSAEMDSNSVFDFCIHPDDCDCEDWDAVDKFARKYMKTVELVTEIK